MLLPTIFSRHRLTAALDAYYKFVSLLLTGDGAANGANNNTFVDSSPNNYAITATGSPAQGSFSPYGNLWSNYFNGSTDYLTTNNPNLQLAATGVDFTFEAWINPSLIGDTVIAGIWPSGGATGWQWILLVLNGQIAVDWAPLTTAGPALTAGSVKANEWTHIALVRSGSTFTLYQDGTSVGSFSSSGTAPSNNLLMTIGNTDPATTGYYGGYISNLRIVTGTALYTTNFTPSTSPLTAVPGTQLLTCQSNRFIDNSSNKSTITVGGTPLVQRFSPFNPTSAYSKSTVGGSGYFNGSNYLSSGRNANAIPGTGDFTIEAWVYTTVSSTSGATANHIIGYDNYGVTSDWILQILNNVPSLYVNTTITAYSGPALVLGQWNHIAAVRQSGVLTIYTNGVGGTPATVTASLNYGSGTPMTLGASSNGAYQKFTGYISDARVVNGTALYTTNFTPPTSTLTAVTNTQFLENFTNAGIIDASMQNDLITYGNAQISTSTVKYGTGSIYFDGTSYLTTTSMNTANLNPWNEDFTIEAWVNYSSLTIPGSYPTHASPLLGLGDAATSLYWSFGPDQNNQLTLYYWTGSQNNISSTVTVSANVWNHIAVSYQASTRTALLFLNGTQVASGTVSSSVQTNANLPLHIGGLASGFVHGYVDDLRVTTGNARYTANFTPPGQLPTY